MKNILPIVLLLALSCKAELKVDIKQNPIQDASIIEEENSIRQEDIKPDTQNILIVGDSEAVFVSHYLKEVKKPTETIYVNAKSGTGIQYWSGDKFKNVLSEHPNIDVVIIFLGTNNIAFYSRDKKLPDTNNILENIKSNNINCIWVGPPKVYGSKHLINEPLKNAVEPICTYLSSEDLDIPLIDNVHPTPDGSIKWLKEVWKIKDDL